MPDARCTHTSLRNVHKEMRCRMGRATRANPDTPAGIRFNELLAAEIITGARSGFWFGLS